MWPDQVLNPGPLAHESDNFAMRPSRCTATNFIFASHLNRYQLLKNKISPHGSKFFPLRANPMTGRLHSTGRHVWINTASDKRGY